MRLAYRMPRLSATTAKVSVSNAVVLGNNADVGIGTTEPTTKLHIVSSAAGQSGVRLENLTQKSPAVQLNQTKFLTVDGTGNVILASTNSSGREGAALWQSEGSYIRSGNEGAVIIGSEVNKIPAGYNLFVSKGIMTEKVRVAIKNSEDWSDKVFDKGYKLSSLPEVNQYIKTNKHLPGIPAAVDVVQHGIDVGKMDAMLLGKIEELTLYSIQLEKENQQQRQINKQQTDEIRAVKQKQIELESLLKEVLKRK